MYDMKVLAIDSSGLTASVAIVEDTHTVAEYTVNYTQSAFRNSGDGKGVLCHTGGGTGGIHPVKGKKTHSQTLLPMIDEMVKMADFDLADVDAIAVAGGPGSFTGLRIGSATAKGLGLALGKPLIHIPTVDSLAYQVYGCGDIICPVMDARREQVYTGIYTYSDEVRPPGRGMCYGMPSGYTYSDEVRPPGRGMCCGMPFGYTYSDEVRPPRRGMCYGMPFGYTFSREEGKEEGTKEAAPEFRILEAQMVISLAELIQRLNNYGRPVVLLGDGVPVYREMLASGLKVPYSFAPAYMNRQRAAVVGEMGIRYYRAGRYETAMEHRPEYLRLSQAERERMQREKTEKVVVRSMAEEDAAAAAEIEYQSFPDPWSQKSVLETIANPQTICLAAEKAGRLIGILFVYIAAGEAEIARIAVIKEQQKQGTGRRLLEALEEDCRKNKIQKLMLDVRESNEGARAFYTKAGFVEDGIRKGFYAEPVEDAVLMSKEICCKEL